MKKYLSVLTLIFVTVAMQGCQRLDARFTGWYYVSNTGGADCYLAGQRLYVDVREDSQRIVRSVDVRDQVNKSLFRWEPAQESGHSDLDLRGSEIGGLAVERSLRKNYIKGSKAVKSDGFYSVGSGMLVLPFGTIESSSTVLKATSARQLKLTIKSTNKTFFIVLWDDGSEATKCTFTRM